MGYDIKLPAAQKDEPSIQLEPLHRQAHAMLDQYRDSLDGKEARFIHYCDMMTNLYWTNGDFPVAIKWGETGVRLKAETGVDTRYTSEHHLALAQRDSGAIDPALTFFLQGISLDEVINPDIMHDGKHGSYYGNIGRCLQFMGQIEPALICYWKSAKLIESGDALIENHAYIRQWVGELLLKRNDLDAAKFFLVASVGKWQLVFPPRKAHVITILEKNFPGYETSVVLEEAEKSFQEWVKSANVGL